jgi:hypothetical protein
MSHVSARVRFSDGAIWHAEYDGTANHITPAIWRTVKELNEAWRKPIIWEKSCTCGADPEVCEYVEDYANGSHGWVSACRACGALVDWPHDDQRYAVMATGWWLDGQPEWTNPEPRDRSHADLEDPPSLEALRKTLAATQEIDDMFWSLEATARDGGER